MTRPLLTVLMPVYNCAPLLPATLDGLLAQSFRDYEVLVCDNASTDGTLAVAEDYRRRDARIRVGRNERNIGPVGNSAHCLRSASTRYAMFLSGDDLIQPGILERLVEVAERRRGLAYVYGKYVDFRTEPQWVPLTGTAETVLPWHEAFAALSREVNYVPYSCTLFDRELAIAVGGFETRLALTADYHFWLRLAGEEASVAYLPEIAMYYRVHAASDTAQLRGRYRHRNTLELTMAKLLALSELPRPNLDLVLERYPDVVAKNCLRGLVHGFRAYPEDPVLAEEAYRLATGLHGSRLLGVAAAAAWPLWALARLRSRMRPGARPS